MIEGMGDQAVSIPIEQLRDINLPHAVEIIAVLPALPYSDHDLWRYPPPPHVNRGKLLFLHIRHPYCFRHPLGAPLCHEPIEEFRARFLELLERELKEST